MSFNLTTKPIYLPLLLTATILFALIYSSACTQEQKSPKSMEQFTHFPSDSDRIKAETQAILNASKTQYETRIWRKMKCGLYQSPEGDIGLASNPSTVNIDWSKLDPEACPNSFITTFGYRDTTTLSSTIDTTTFKYLGANFYGDKKHIYAHTSMCSDGRFNIISTNITSFKVISECYAKDNEHFYYYGHATPLKVDYASFQLINKSDCFAKDKNTYYYAGSKLDSTDLFDKKQIVELKNELLVPQ